MWIANGELLIIIRYSIEYSLYLNFVQIPGVMETNMMVMIQPKNNMYTEMFKIE